MFVPGKPFRPSVIKLQLLGSFLSYKENEVLYMQTMCHIRNTLSSLQLTHGPSMLECLFLASLSYLVLYNTLAYYAHS